MTNSVDSINVLHVDDEPDFADLAADFIQRHDDRLSVEPTTSAQQGLERLRANGFDCVVSDYDMPGENGIEFLKQVRDAAPDLPFILYTGKGSEEVASQAISAGVTDYLQKESGMSQYDVLANRITNVVEQHRAQAEVQRTEERLRTISENTNDILWKFTADWEELLFINSPYEEIWGRSIEELETRPQSFLEGIHPDDRPRVEEAMETISSGEPVDIEYRVNAKEDYGRWVWVQGEPVFDDDGNVENVVGFARDVTDRKAEAEWYEALIEQSTDVVTVLDEDGVVRYQSPSVERILGYQPEELEGEIAFEYIHPADADEIFQTFTSLIEQTDTVTEEVRYRFRHADGSWIWLETIGRNERNSSVGGYVLNSRDVTKRVERERALEESEERFRQLAESATDAILTIDTGSTIQYANPAVERIFGYDPDEIEGEPLTMLMPERLRADHQTGIDRYLETGERTRDWTSIQFLRTPQGRPRDRA
ncbi:MAG: PAS domain S-box protein [Halobacteriales archaeon]|nr:PAS domain S-box protein [Halobacteriales archaeon]